MIIPLFAQMNLLLLVCLWLLPLVASRGLQVQESHFLTGLGNDKEEEGVGHLSEWSREMKDNFLQDLREDNAQDWLIVMGNEGGDLDSMVSALALAYYYWHEDPKQKAIALLQTDHDALPLRPENILALQFANMSSGHRDLLTLEELPVRPFDMYHRIQGIVLVDHNVALSDWDKANVQAIFDHHSDRGLYPNASPRVVGRTASCVTLVSKYMLDELEYDEHHVPMELADLILRTIALDSGGLKKRKSTSFDYEMARRLLPYSSWPHEDQKTIMSRIGDEMKSVKNDVDFLDLRGLLRRDWKGDRIATLSKKYPFISLGFASVPVSLNDQIRRTPEKTAPEWFAVERAFTSEMNVDVSVVLTNYRDPLGQKVREIVLCVAHGYGNRLTEKAADSLFYTLKDAIENAENFEPAPWHRPDQKPLLPRRMAWIHHGDHGRKQLRPLIEEAARTWGGSRKRLHEL